MCTRNVRSRQIDFGLYVDEIEESASADDDLSCSGSESDSPSVTKPSGLVSKASIARNQVKKSKIVGIRTEIDHL